jgi:tRNA threonylcarbamoyladenosine biosynthesis protein TsaB
MTEIPEECKILAIDTTSKNCSLSLLTGENVLLEYNFVSGNNLSSILIPSIMFILGNIKIKLEEINIFAIGIGPGLFTGIRIGLSTIKGMLFSNPKPIIPINNLEVLAHKFKQSDAPIVSLIDAKRDEVYVGGYDFKRTNKTEIIHPDLIPIEKLKFKLKTLNHFHFTGDGTIIHEDYLKNNFKNSKHFNFPPFQATEMGKLAFKKYLKKDFILNLKDLKPYYLRKPDAEKNRIKIPTNN